MSTWYRRNARMRKGQKEYTSCGFEHAKKYFKADDLDVDCSEKHYLITGSNRGIGLVTALEIARRGGVVHFLCRNRASMLEGRSHIITNTGNDRLHLHTLDLSRPRDVGRWAQDFVSTHERLDVLIHNAGSMSNERTVDDDGIETTFAVNTLSVHLLTIIILPLLQRSPDPRVVTVSSSDLLHVKLDSEDFHFELMDPFDGYLAYSQTKRQQVVMNCFYAHRYEKVRFYSMHPGWVDTKLLKRSQPEFYSLNQHTLRTPSQGADTGVWLAVSDAASKHASGSFFHDRHPVSQHLPLAWTKHTTAEERTFMQKLDQQLALVSSYSYNFEDSSESGLDEYISNESPAVDVQHSLEGSTSDIAPHNSDSVVDYRESCKNEPSVNTVTSTSRNTVNHIENNHCMAVDQSAHNSNHIPDLPNDINDHSVCSDSDILLNSISDNVNIISEVNGDTSSKLISAKFNKVNGDT